MRRVNNTVLSHRSDQSANGDQIDANQLVSASFQATFGNGDEAGTFKIQASNDLFTSDNPSFVVTNWTDIPSATASISSGASSLITINQLSYRWIRAVYTRSGGGAAGKLTVVNIMALSV